MESTNSHSVSSEKENSPSTMNRSTEKDRSDSTNSIDQPPKVSSRSSVFFSTASKCDDEIRCYFPYSDDLPFSMAQMLEHIEKLNGDRSISHVQVTLSLYNNGLKPAEDTARRDHFLSRRRRHNGNLKKHLVIAKRKKKRVRKSVKSHASTTCPVCLLRFKYPCMLKRHSKVHKTPKSHQIERNHSQITDEETEDTFVQAAANDGGKVECEMTGDEPEMTCEFDWIPSEDNPCDEFLKTFDKQQETIDRDEEVFDKVEEILDKVEEMFSKEEEQDNQSDTTIEIEQPETERSLSPDVDPQDTGEAKIVEPQLDESRATINSSPEEMDTTSPPSEKVGAMSDSSLQEADEAKSTERIQVEEKEKEPQAVQVECKTCQVKLEMPKTGRRLLSKSIDRLRVINRNNPRRLSLQTARPVLSRREPLAERTCTECNTIFASRVMLARHLLAYCKTPQSVTECHTSRNDNLIITSNDN